jgi:hypothetical protein
MESRDFSDFEVGAMAATVFPDEAPLRLDAGADRGAAFRLGAEMRFWDLETNKDRRVGVMVKAPSCARLLSQSKEFVNRRRGLRWHASAFLRRRTGP